MNPANLPFDSESMLQGLRGWVECESPTWDAGAVERMLDLAAREMAIMGATIERIGGRQGFGGVIRARFPHPKQGEPGILIAGHMDTVHPVGTLAQLVAGLAHVLGRRSADHEVEGVVGPPRLGLARRHHVLDGELRLAHLVVRNWVLPDRPAHDPHRG